MMKNIILSITIVALLGILSPLYAAKVAFRLTVKDGVLQEYYDNPDSFPICREKLGYLSFSTRVDPCIRDDGERLFLTTEATAEIFRGDGPNFTFTGEETVRAIRSYEDQGFTLAYAIIYHEDWLQLGGPGGPYSEDIRILSPQELADVRAAIAASDLRSKDTVKIIQLLGGRVAGHRGDTWTQITNNPALMAHLQNFDGVGTECHVGDHNPDVSDGPETLDAMAQITQWCVQNGDIGFVFMGGAAGSYTQLASMRATYNYLWNEMDALGVAKDRTDLLYFRQGAREGTHLPENRASLTFQVAELIGKVENPLDGAPTEPTSGLVAHWPLDEGSGTIATNTAGSSYTATLENGTTWGSDAERGTFAIFDGTDDRIETTFTYALADTNDFTWAWWAKQLDTETGSIMVGNRYGNSGSETYEFIKFMRNKAAFSNTDNTANIEDYDYSDLSSNEWHHYAMVKSGTSYQWYVDGVAQGSPVTINYSETSPIPFLIGGDGDNKPNEHFEGCIDDVVLYRQALTPEDVVNVKDGFYPYVPLDYGLIAGWERWASGSSPATMQTNGIVATATTSDFGISKWGASSDGTFGSLEAPAASALSDVHEEGLRKAGAVDVSIDFTLENTTAYDMQLEKFYFDALLKAAETGPERWNLQVVSGPVTIGQIVDKALDYSETGSDFADYEVDLTTLADHTLDAGSTVVFRLSFTGGDAANTSNTDLDNVAITGAFYDIPSVNTAPTISDIIDQVVIGNTATEALAFTVSDAGTPALGLTLSKTSSDTTLVPEANIVFGGSGADRTVTVTQATGESGEATISVIVSDGELSATNSFQLTVYPEGSAYYSVTNNTAGTSSWTCPTGVTAVQVECWGGGGAGGAANASANNVGGGGGAGGTYARTANVPVTPGNSYTITIPAAATAPAGSVDGARFDGAAVSFIGDSSVTVTAAGGQGGECKVAGVNTSGTGGVGSAAGCIGDIVFAGGNGSQWGDRNGGCGGGGAGNANPGGNAVEGTAGLGGTEGGGDGAGGRAGNASGQNGSNPGGGGGGAKSQSSGPLAGGTGGLGQIIITYVVVPVVETPMLEYSMSGGDMIFNWTGSDFKVQSRTNLTEGAWQYVPGGGTPPVTNSSADPACFFRLIQQ
ncbi:hypothetical protein P4B35_05375 [Pontiellaceae bacterium B12227]|nr:hypothetical protein [Pontiellaceae bacterium B12227]